MIFSSLQFIFIYLVVVLGLYYLIPNRTYRNVILCVFSLLFYAWGEPVCIFLMLFSIMLNYVCGLIIGRCRSKENKRGAKATLIVSIVLNIGMLGVFKYTPMVFDTLKALIPSMSGIETPVAKQLVYDWLGGFIPALKNFEIGAEYMLPIGISFYTFQAMSYVIDVYRNDAPLQKNPMLFGTYVALFPQLIAGPIVRYKDVADQLCDRRENISQFASGIKLFAIGMAKKVLIANQMAVLWAELRSTYATNGALGSWIGIISYAIQIYFDFSGYSDMAIGLGRMFGFEFLKNFNYPYIAQSVGEFWNRWHISLGTWFKEYVYIPLGGNRKGLARQLLNVSIVWALTGLWHGASWNFVLWGLYFGLLLILEKAFMGKVLKKLPRAFRHIYTFVLIMFSWVLFDFTDMTHMGYFLQSLFDFNSPAISSEALMYALSYLPLMVIGIIAATPLVRNIHAKLEAKHRWVAWADIVLVIVSLVLCVSSLVSSGYNPFIYFRF